VLFVLNYRFVLAIAVQNRYLVLARSNIGAWAYKLPEQEHIYMSRVCYFTGKRTVAGRKIARRGKAKYLGGVGRKITGSTKRKFKANIQKVRAVVDGTVTRVRVSAKAIHMGLVHKPPKRNYQPAEKAAG